MTGFFFPQRCGAGDYGVISQEGIGTPRAGVRGSLEPPISPPEEQQALLTPKPPRLRPHFHLCYASERLLFSVWPSVPLTCFLVSRWPFAGMKHFYIPNTVEALLLARNANTNANTVMHLIPREKL